MAGNDLKLSFCVKHERLVRFLDLQDALDHYNDLPHSAAKSLGVSCGEQDLELVRCLPGEDGENVLVMDFLDLPLWRNRQTVIAPIASELVSSLDIHRCLAENKLVPAPAQDTPSRNLEDKYLWPANAKDPASSIRWIYAPGLGWLSPAELQRRIATQNQEGRYPFVTKIRADGVTDKGCYAPLEVTYWEYKLLERRTRVRMNQEQA